MPRFPARILVLLIAVLLCAPLVLAADDDLREQINKAIMDADWPTAIPLLEQHIEHAPNDVQALYNLACGHAQVGDLDQSAQYLYLALQAGFDDFEHLRTDPDLKPLHRHPVYRKIFDQAPSDDSDPDPAHPALEKWRAKFGDKHYRYEVDDRRNLVFATALDDTSHLEMCAMLQTQADYMAATLFGDPPAYEVLIAVPTTEDAHTLFGGRDEVGGMYVHANRQLIARDIGGTLRHEFVHAMHFGHMERLGLRTGHHIWVQEGLACLFEDYTVNDDGTLTFVPNTRHNIMKGRLSGGVLIKWDDLLSMTPQEFMDDASRLYPQVRSMFRFIADEDKLKAWYRAYVDHFEDDRSGRRAFEVAFDQPLNTTERQWRKWLAKQPRLDTRIRTGDAALGITTREGLENDGVLVTGVLRHSTAARAGLRRGDVIVSVNDHPVRRFTELVAYIGKQSVGDDVSIRYRRDGEYRTVQTRLRPHRGGGRS